MTSNGIIVDRDAVELLAHRLAHSRVMEVLKAVVLDIETQVTTTSAFDNIVES